MQRNHTFSDIDTRSGLQAYLGNSGFAERDLYDTFGWIDDPDEHDYYATYLRNPVAKAVVDKPAETTWREYPEIQDTDNENTTDFEAGVEQLHQRHQVWSYANRVDRLAGIGEYGIMVVGFADGRDLDQPVDTKQLSDPSDIAWFRVFPQISVSDIEFERDQSSPRWGMPVEYDVDLSDADDAEDGGAFGSVTVHHERVIHVPSTELLDDEVRGTPRQEPVFNPLNDIEKVVGSVSELAYRGADYGLHIDVDPEYDFDPDDLNEELQRYVHQVQNFIKTQGASVETLGGEIADPSGIVDTLMSLIAAQTGIPKRMLMGSEQGELASSQDVANYFGRISERQTQYAEQHIVRNLIDRLRDFGMLPDPENGLYDVHWPNLFELNELEEADVKNTRAQTLKNMAPQGNTDLVATAEKRVEFIESGDASVLAPDTSQDVPAMPTPSEETPEQQEAFDEFFLNESVDRTPPEQAQTNAQAVLDVREKTDAMTETGWRRAKQLADGGELSTNVIEKMAQFKRHQSNTEYENYSDIPESKKSGDDAWWEDNGTVAWLGWGGTAGIEWAVEQSEELERNATSTNFSNADTSPIKSVPVFPDGLETLTKPWLVRWAEWIAAGRPPVSNAETFGYLGALNKLLGQEWNPALHPRDPETGKFVERPFDVPSNMPDFADESPAEILGFIADSGGNVDAVLRGDISIDGVPDDVSSLSELREEETKRRAERTGGFNEVGDETGVELAKQIPTSEKRSEIVVEDNGAPISEELANDIYNTIGEVLARTNDQKLAREYARRTGYIGDESQKKASYNGSVSLQPGDGQRMVMANDSRDTMRHEMGHGIAQSFGFNKQDTSAAWDRNYWPEEGSDPETITNLLVGKGDTDAVGFDEWKEDVDEEIAGPPFRGPQADLENLQPGDLLKFEDSPSVFTDAKVWEVVGVSEGKTRGVNYEIRDKTGYTDTVKIRGGEAFGDDVANTLKGYSNPDRAAANEETRFTGRPLEQIQQTRERVAAMGAEEKVREFVSQANRAFYKMHRANNELGERAREQFTIKTDYSSTNAHETISEMNEVMQIETDHIAREAAQKLSTHHPKLLGTYLAMFDPSPTMKEKLQVEVPNLG